MLEPIWKVWYAVRDPALLIVLAVALLFSLRVVAAVIRRPRPGRLRSRCARCRYEASDFASFTCPECGSDVRRVGIISWYSRARTARAALALVLATTYLAAIALVASWAALESLYTQLAERQHTTVQRLELTPASNRYTASIAVHNTVSPLIGIADSTVYVSVHNHDGDSSLKAARRFFATSPSPFARLRRNNPQRILLGGIPLLGHLRPNTDAQPADFELTHAISAYELVGIDPTPEPLWAELQELLSLVQIVTIRANPSLDDLTLTHFTSAGPTWPDPPRTPAIPLYRRALWDALPIALPITVAVLWLISLFLLLRRRARTLRWLREHNPDPYPRATNPPAPSPSPTSIPAPSSP